MKGLITEIQHGSIHDGPGLRTVVFLKGCQLRCFWCHNPESILPERQLSFDSKKCLMCGKCFSLCNAHCLIDGRHEINRTLCNGCGRCVEACFPGALSICGTEYTVEQALNNIMEDQAFFKESGGGVTISGGEPGCQAEFTSTLLGLCRNAGIHCAVETNLDYTRSIQKMISANSDLIITDLKHIDPDEHRKGTGHSNRRILDNLHELDKPLILRTPVIPGFNDSEENIAEIAKLASTIPNLLYYELLSYHPLGCAKAKMLGMKEYVEPLPMSNPKEINLADIARKTGIAVYLNGRKSGK